MIENDIIKKIEFINKFKKHKEVMNCEKNIWKELFLSGATSGMRIS